MKALLLGAGGQLGNDLIQQNELLGNPLKVTPWTREHLDLEQLEKIPTTLASLSFDVLINCAAYNGVDRAEEEPKKAMAVNAQAVAVLARVCRERNSHFVHISTDFVFNGEASTPYIEKTATSPINVYGASKALGEELALAEWEKTYIFRTASLFGTRGSREKGGNFVDTIIARAMKGENLQVIRDITMSPTSTHDLAQMILKTINQNAQHGIYHAVNSGMATWYEFALEIVQSCGFSAEVTPILSTDLHQKAKRPHYTVLNNQKTASLIGEIPSWKEALKRYLHEKKHI